MGELLGIDIPESVVTRFLVATDEARPPGARHLRDMLSAGGLGRTARDLLASPLLSVGGGPAAGSPWEGRLDLLGGGDAELAEVRSARRHLPVTLLAGPAAQPRHAQAARLVARTLAVAAGGRVVDLAANQVLAPSDPPGHEPERFVLGQDWLGVFMAPDGDRRLRCDTAGLHRFGMPELVVRHIPYAHLLAAAALVRGLAQRLLADHLAWLQASPHPTHRTIPADRTLAPADLLRYWTGPTGPARAPGSPRPTGPAQAPGSPGSTGSREAGRAAGSAGPNGSAGPRRPPDGGRDSWSIAVRLHPEPALCPECVQALRITAPADEATWWTTAAAVLSPAL